MKEVSIGPGNLADKGIFAAKDFKKGEIVINYNLKPLTEKQFGTLPESEKEFAHTHGGQIYLYIGSERYVNHSENPNTYQDLKQKCDVALRHIKKNEQITTDSTKDDAGS